jgi:hypothetical protein
MKYTDIKQQAQDKQTELHDRLGLFWAFSNEQFHKNKTPLKEGEKYVSIGMGGFLPKNNLDELLQGWEAIEAWKKAEVKKNKAEKEKTILYELNNYESFYSGDITDALEVLKPLGFTRKEVLQVYKANYAKAEL